ncbi:TetR/AcrR family transcriptional regulator [Aquimarina agarivorans]|uniref:TetR/AcrR family transcriptional regulator n=1 Tax=Aquimarina agarivorans TaxID=980584 RepID=UPI000248FB37|nr:TetR/AcrR family transcriptional regulator [Aquimarina agarivorans]
MNPQQVKQHVIEVSSELFYKNGYSGTSMNMIIQATAIQAKQLFELFESKEAICIAFLAQKNEKFLAEIDEFVSKRPVGYERIISVFDFLEILYDSNEFNGCWRVKTISDIPENDQLLKNSIQKHKGEFLNFLEKLIQENEPKLTAEETKTLSKQIYVLYEGAITESLSHNQKWPIATAKALFSRILN